MNLKFGIWKPEVGVCVIGRRPRGVAATIEGEQHYPQNFHLRLRGILGWLILELLLDPPFATYRGLLTQTLVG